MPNPIHLDDRFIDHLLGLRDNRAALAALRRGLGQPPGSQPAMYPYVEPFLQGVHRNTETRLYLIAPLFACHPDAADTGNMGHHFARTCDRSASADNSAIERRFVVLLAAHHDDLHFYLRQAVGYLRSKEVPINWRQLAADLRWWADDDRSVQHNWARAFWGGHIIQP